MRSIRGDGDAAGAFLLVGAVVIDPLFTEDPQAELGPFEVAGLRIAAEGVGRGAEADDRFAGVEELGEIRELVVGELAEARPDDHEVGRVELLGAGDVLLKVRIDVAAVRVDREKDDTIETVFLAEDLAEHGHGLLGAVFLVAGNENDLLAVGGAFLRRQVETVGGGEGETCREQDGQKNESRLHGVSGKPGHTCNATAPPEPVKRNARSGHSCGGFSR